MAESDATGAKEHLEPVTRTTEPVPRPDSKLSLPSIDNQSMADSLVREKLSQPLLLRSAESGSHKAPYWLQPFFSLRVQLTVVYGLLLLLMLICSSMLLEHQSSQLAIMLITLAVVAVGTALAFLFTTLLLRPLWTVTDAAQAIAVGDLEQRERLPLRLPPQDEVDRLAGSLNEMAKRLEHAEEMQNASEERFRRFFSDASHQLRTPLTSIRGFTELMLRGGVRDDPEMAPRILMRMKMETERMTNLINDLLTLARLDDRHPLKLKYLDLVELAVEGTNQTRTRANDERKITLSLATEERLGLQADRERIKQLLFILLDNALKHGRQAPEGTITLKLTKQRGQAIIQVVDNGEGIAQEDLEHIFDAFYRGRHRAPSSLATPAGVGLGLTIASAIVRAHNGTITVCSEMGTGTEFKVTFPCVD